MIRKMNYLAIFAFPFWTKDIIKIIVTSRRI